MAHVAKAKIADFGDLSVTELRKLWAELFNRSAPARLSRDLLARSVAYQIQVKEQGELRRSVRRKLKRLSATGRAGSSGFASRPFRTLQPGVRLMREWNGETHMVEVLADGLWWGGQRYSSLSAVAFAITGSRWSGPRFFGLCQTEPRPEKSYPSSQEPTSYGADGRTNA